jgi:hypothetical protein
MKRSMMVLACMSTVLLQGMENSDHNTLSFLINQTTVKLTKGCMFDADGKVDLMVVGKNQQKMVKRFNANMIIPGMILYPETVYEKNRNDDSASDDDTYKPYMNVGFNNNNEKKWETVERKIMNSELLKVVEPCITRMRKREKKVEDVTDEFLRLSVKHTRGSSCIYDQLVQPVEVFVYNVIRLSPIIPNQLNWLHQTFYGDEAIIEAAKELALCYKNVLAEGLTILDKKQEKSIAISALGTDVGFPREDAAPVAVATILEFIKTSGNDGIEPYALIHLFVKKRSEFARYKELLAEYAVEQK